MENIGGISDRIVDRWRERSPEKKRKKKSARIAREEEQEWTTRLVERHEVGRSTGCVAAATISRQLRRDCLEGGEESDWRGRGRRSAAKVTGKRRTGVAEEIRETARLETKEVEGESVDDSGGGGSGVNGDSGTISEGGRKKNKNGAASSKNGNSGASSGVSGGGLSCRGGTLRLLRGLVEGPIGRVAARVHRWGTAGGVNPSAPSGRECPGGEGTPRRNVLDATKNRRLMGANLTKQSRVSRSRGGCRVCLSFPTPATRLTPSSRPILLLSFLYSTFLPSTPFFSKARDGRTKGYVDGKR